MYLSKCAQLLSTTASTDRELSCERTQVKTYFTHLNKVLSKNNSISLSVRYVNNVFGVFTCLSDSPLLWNYMFSPLSLTVNVNIISAAGNDRREIISINETRQTSQRLLISQSKRRNVDTVIKEYD